MSGTDTPENVGGGRGENGREGPPPVVARSESGVVTRWEPPRAEDIADAFPGLKVVALCGVGGMGAVYRAEQVRLGRSVALKILSPAALPDLQARERFEREARILSGINHPHVLRIHDFGALADGTLYFVMEWADGGDLSKRLGGKPQSIAQTRAWVRQIAEALGAAHARGVVHRDLKPANVLVLEDGRLTLGDFGLALAGGGAGFHAGLTQSGTVFGTFEYMAPEQIEATGKVTPASDLYSLGVMTYLMLTGRVPRGAYTKPSRLAKLPSEVDDFINVAMANEPARRPRDAAEFSRLFDRACTAPQRRRHRQLIGLGVALVALALGWARVEVIRIERQLREAEERNAKISETMRRLRENRQERDGPRPGSRSETPPEAESAP